MMPAKAGAETEVPETIESDPSSTIIAPSWWAAASATSGTDLMPSAAAVPLTIACHAGCAYTVLTPPPEAHNPVPPSSALSFHTISGM